MSKYTSILLWVPLMFGVLFFCCQVRIYQNDIISFEQYVLNKQVNYAAESATEELLNSGKLSQDYNDGDFQTYEPAIAVRDFAQTMCISNGIIPTETAIKNYENSKIRTMVVCVYDGIYSYQIRQTETHAFELSQTPKIPYFYTDENGHQYCLTLNPDKGYWDEGDSVSTYKLHDYDTYTNRPSNAQQATAINNQISDILNYSLYDSFNNNKKGREATVKIPAIGETVRGGQTVASPTVIAVVDGYRSVFSTYLTAQCIGGGQIEEPNYVVGYNLNNAVINRKTFSGKYYAYSSWWEKHPNVKATASNGRYFDDVFEAAKNGYNNLNLLE